MNKGLCLCIALAFAAPSLAQISPRQAPPPGLAPMQAPEKAQAFGAFVTGRDRVEGLIKLDVLVTDATTKPISGLNREDFSLLESGRAQKILSFEAFDGRGEGSEPPVKIILLIDTLELPAELARNERLAVEGYLGKNGGRLTHPTSVFLLSDAGIWEATHPFGDGNALAREIEHDDFTLLRHNVGWETQRASMPRKKDSASASALKALALIATVERTRPGRKLLVWVGPGWGVGSGAYAEAAQGSAPLFQTVWWFSTLLREAQVVLYNFTVGETDPSSLDSTAKASTLAQIYKGYLDGVRLPRRASFMNVDRKVLAVQSGGRVMDASFDLVQEIESCVEDAGPFYRISFDPFPTDHPDEYHDLKVVVKRPGLKARTSTGYYDEPYYSPDEIPAPKRMSVAQLEQLLTSAVGESDADLARELSQVALTERLSERTLSSLDGTERGKRVRHELRILADTSAFLEPPADEAPAEAPPDREAQLHMLSLASEYLSNTVRKLPDFFAKQTTVRYQETPMYMEGVKYQSLHITDHSATTVRYRNGFEIVDSEARGRARNSSPMSSYDFVLQELRRHNPNNPQLITYGVFGPALEGVLAMLGNKDALTWSHWEQGPSGRMAVFRYEISAEESLYQSACCCLPDGDGTEALLRYTGYSGEIGIDRASGALLRMVFQFDLKSTTPLALSKIMIEYGPVEIGGRSYICPLRSVSVVRTRSVRVLTDSGDAFRTYGPYSTMLNDISFDDYHIFRSESHVLPDFTPTQK